MPIGTPASTGRVSPAATFASISARPPECTLAVEREIGVDRRVFFVNAAEAQPRRFYGRRRAVRDAFHELVDGRQLYL